MTRQEYADYEARVAAFFDREGITNLSSTGTEPWFSWQPCECCRRPEGGERERATGRNPETGEVHEYIVCLDCTYFAEFGRLDDDETM
jgi:hypothetical protein